MWSSGSRPTAVFLAALAAGGCTATLRSGPGLQRDVDSLRVSVDRLRQEQADTRARLDSLSGPAAADDLQDRLGMMLDRIAALEAQVQALARQWEVSDDRLGSLAYDLDRMRRRVEQLDRRAGAPPPESAPLPRSMEPPDEPVPQTAEPRLAPRISRGDDPAGVFQKAYADYTRGDYDLAALGFANVLERLPDGILADDAAYYLAEIAAAKGRSDEALRGYARVVEQYPDGDKVPAALLKRGLLLLDANRIGEGVVQLDHLVKSYPETDEARLARNRLRALGVGP